MKTTWVQRQVPAKYVWTLPPPFAIDVIDSASIQELINDYAEIWMPPFDDLKYVYVPIRDSCDNWFLMVVSIQGQMVYHMDPFVAANSIPPRLRMMKKMWEAITQIMKSDHYPPNFLQTEYINGEWDTSDPIGMVTNDYCQHSGVWVLGWMGMEDMFQPNTTGLVHEDVIRMRVAMEIIMWEQNELAGNLKAKAVDSWLSKH